MKNIFHKKEKMDWDPSEVTVTDWDDESLYGEQEPLEEEYYEEEPIAETPEEYYEDEPVEEAPEEYYEEEPIEEAPEEYYEEEPVEEAPEEYYEEEAIEEAPEEYYEEEPIEEASEEYYEEEQVAEAPEEYYEEVPVEEASEEYYEEAATVEIPVITYEEEPGINDPQEYYEEEPPYQGRAPRQPRAKEPAPQEYYEEEVYENNPDEYYEEGACENNPDEYYEEEPVYVEPPRPARQKEQAVKAAAPAPQKRKKKKAVLGVMDIMVIGTGVAVLVVAVFMGALLLKGSKQKTKTPLFAGIGSQVADIDLIGGNGIAAVAATTASQDSQEPVQEPTGEDPAEESQEYEEIDMEKAVTVKMATTSVQKDLKIKFSNKDTGKLVGNVPFSVAITKPDKTKETWVDEDMDGIIYKKGIEPGEYGVAMTELKDAKYKDYLISTTTQTTEVKKTITYAQVDVGGEGKTESEVNTAVEDTGMHNTQVESSLQDTVQWVASSQSAEDYAEIPQSDITDPDTLMQTRTLQQKAFPADGTAAAKASLISEAARTIKAGESFTLEATYLDDETNARLPFDSVKWSSNNTAVATVSDKGEVKGIAGGTAIISYDAVIFLDGEDKRSTQSCNVTVEGPAAPSNPGPDAPPSNGLSVTVDVTTLSVPLGDRALAAIAVHGFDPSRSMRYTVKSEDESIAKAFVDGLGIIQVEGIKKGTTQILVSANYENGDDSTKASTSFTAVVGDGTSIPADPSQNEGLTLSQPTVSLKVGEETTIKASVAVTKPGDTLLLSNADATIASAVTDGMDIKIQALKVGTTTLTAKYVTVDKEYTATCTITVQSSAREDKVTRLLDSLKRQVYVIENGKYREAVYADYYTADKFYILAKGGYTGWQTIDGNVYYFDANGNKVTGEQVIQGARYTFDENGVLQTGNGTMGIDVSKWNGKIDWAAVKNSGVSYVIIRCGYRGSSEGALIEDSMFTSNISGAAAAGLKVGVYFFTQAVDEVEAVYEASYVIDKIKNYRITYPVFLDVEPSGGRGDKLDKATRTAVCKAFCETMRSAGYTAGIYANKTWLTEKLDAGALSNYKIWLAQYAATPSYTGKYDIWQYKSNGRVSGITGDVDLNISYIK